jgi:hypothetical protein
VGFALGQHRAQPLDARLDQPGQGVGLVEVEPGDGEVERIGADDDLAETLVTQGVQRLAAGLGDAPDLPFRVGAFALDPDLFDQALGREALDRTVQPAHRDVGPHVDVLFLGQLAQLVPVHLALDVEGAEDEQTDGRHATTPARVVACVKSCVTPHCRRLRHPPEPRLLSHQAIHR